MSGPEARRRPYPTRERHYIARSVLSVIPTYSILMLLKTKLFLERTQFAFQKNETKRKTRAKLYITIFLVIIYDLSVI